MGSSTERAPEFAELLGRTNYSFLEGASHAEEMVATAKEAGLAALGIADRDGLYGIVKAHQAAKEAGLPLVIGARMTVGGIAAPVVLLARDGGGYAALCSLITEGRMRNPKGVCSVTVEELERCASGCWVIDTSWVRALPPAPSLREGGVAEIAALFGDRFSIAITHHLSAGDDARLARAVASARALDAPLVATNDPYFHAPARRALHDVLAAVREKTTVAKLGRRALPNAEWHVKSGARMATLLAAHPASLARSVEIARGCSFSLDSIRYQYPDEWLPAGYTPMGWLRHLVEGGGRERYPAGVPDDVRLQLAHELKLIEQLDFAPYFLTVWDIVRFARDKKILCQGRGSAANSAVCFVLGITAIDPVRMNLLFERFISAERGEPPDIDVDFEHERREEVIQHIYAKYGRDRAAMVANVVTYRHKMAVRETGKALGLSTPQIDRLSRAADERDLDARFIASTGLDPRDPTLLLVLERTRELLGFPRHLGIHSGGFSITHGKLCEIVPTENATMPGRTIVEWDKEDLAAVGILKIDVLALGMLTMIRMALDLMRAHEGVDLELATIPAEDAATYDMICAADTVGVFQIESRAQMNTLPRMLPRTFYDLVIEIALIRPGPITGGMVQPLLRRRAGLEPVTYAHPVLEPILKRTYGVPVFQEQAIRLAVVAAGFTPGEADELRRAMTHKRSTERLGRLHARLLEGMAERGITAEKADEVVQQLSGFAGYGFPESHSASFALLVYASAWLKRHHHAAFSCGLLNAWPMGFYAPHTLVYDAQRHGVAVHAVDVTKSAWHCTLERATSGAQLSIRVGYRYVKGLGEKVKATLDAALAAGGPFTSWDDMTARAPLPRDAMARIAAADGFRSLGLSRREALWAALRAPPHPDEEVFADGGHGEKPGRFTFPELAPREEVTADYDALALSTRAHPVSFFRAAFDREGILSSTALAPKRNRTRVRVGGMAIVRQRPPTATNVVFMTLEDETGFLNLVVSPEVYDRDRPLARDALFVIAEGTVERAGAAINIQVARFLPLSLDSAGTAITLPARNFH